MPASYFKYIAQDKNGRRVTHTMRGLDVSSVVEELKAKDLLPLKVYAVNSAGKKKKSFFKSERVHTKEIVVFTRQLAATLSSGLLLTEGLEAIAEDLDNEYFQKVIFDITKDIRGGTDFSNALTKYPKVFPSTYVAIIKSGEAVGKLDKTTAELAKYLENAWKMQEKVITSLRYPIFILSFAIFVVFVIVFFLIPKFKVMFEGAGNQLPLLTRIVVGFSESSLHFFPLIILAVIGGWIGFTVGMKNPKFRYAMDVLKFKLPVVGKEIIYKSCVSSFCRTLSALLSGGVPLALALDITSQVVNHGQLSACIMDVRSKVLAGSSLASEIRAQNLFPALVNKMLNVGERTGRVSDMLQRSAEYYDDELENSLSRLTALLEPMLIVFIGGVVLIVVLALYLPIFHMSGAIK